MGLAIVCVRSARAAAAARCLATLSSRDSSFLAREFVGSSFLVRGASAFRCDCALRLRIHCRESARSLATYASGVAGINTAIIPVSADVSIVAAKGAAACASGSVVPSAPLVHSVLLVDRLVCHYSISCRNFEFEEGANAGHP